MWHNGNCWLVSWRLVPPPLLKNLSLFMSACASFPRGLKMIIPANSIIMLIEKEGIFHTLKKNDETKKQISHFSRNVTTDRFFGNIGYWDKKKQSIVDQPGTSCLLHISMAHFRVSSGIFPSNTTTAAFLISSSWRNT